MVKQDSEGFYLEKSEAEAINPNELLIELARLSAAFPAMKPEQIKSVADAAKRNRLTQNDLERSISHAIDTCLYQVPSVALCIANGAKKRLKSRAEVLSEIHNGSNLSFADFKRHDFDGQILYSRNE